MSTWVIIAAVLFVGIGLAHSALGERVLLRPLLDEHPLPALSVSPTFAKRTLRFAWHLTTVAWFGLAAVLLIEDASMVRATVATVALVTGVVTLLASRGSHFAWPVFLSIPLCIAMADLQVPAVGVQVIAVALAAVFASIAAMHVYWVAGGRRGLEAVVPSVDGRPAFVPGAALTLAVAAALAGAGVIALAAGFQPAPWNQVLMGVGAAVFFARVIGDLRTCGLFKRIKGTTFARLDTRVYVPLCFALASACLMLV